MNRLTKICLFLLLNQLSIIVFSCNNSDTVGVKKIVSNPEKMDKYNAVSIKESMEYAMQNNGKLDDSNKLMMSSMVQQYYALNEYEPIWSKKEKWEPIADSVFDYISNGALDGLFPKDYHYKNLRNLKNLLTLDSLSKMDASLWAKADILFTDGLMHVLKDLKHGRLLGDSIAIKDSVNALKFYTEGLSNIVKNENLSATLYDAQPKHAGYWNLKAGIKSFLDSMDKRVYTYVSYPFTRGVLKDSINFIKVFQKRLSESGCIDVGKSLPDSLSLAVAIKKIQRQKGFKQDGVVTSALIRALNVSDTEKFKQIAITLDRYKQLPAKMPEKYIWVNLPAYYLQVWNKDSMVLFSKVICGKPETRTPLIRSEISDMVTYPTWTVPTSIIVKQYLPKLKNNPNYLTRIGLKLVNGKGASVDGGNINWAKYTKGIPFRVVQNSGDNNALGIFKFNFNNPHAVYLHDTNQRYLFKNAARALSHGCVRVQEWEKLAFYIAKNDSLNTKASDSLRYNTDSIKNWISLKENHMIEVKNRVPLFIQYFSCEGINNKIKFYSDIYDEDKMIREKYFINKQL
jgi:L,D-transpeptidase YcbB